MGHKIDEIEELDGSSRPTPVARWEAAYESYLALNEDSVNLLVSGTLHKSDGIPLRVKHFTMQMVAENSDLRTEFNQTKNNKFLVGIDKDGNVHVHEDIAKLLGETQRFQIDNSQGGMEEINATVKSVSSHAYTITLVALNALLILPAAQAAQAVNAAKEALKDPEPHASLQMLDSTYQTARPPYMRRKTTSPLCQELFEAFVRQMTKKRDSFVHKLIEKQRAQRQERNDERRKAIKKEIKADSIKEDTIKAEIQKTETLQQTLNSQLPGERPKKTRPLGT